MRAHLLAIAALLAGCKVGPDFRRPEAAAPALWGPTLADVPSRTAALEVDPHWWTRFGDSELNSLVARLVSQNLDLQQAAERIEEGRAERRIAAAQGLPQLNERSFYQRNRVSKRGVVRLFTPAPGAPLDYDLFQNGISVSWELDLFGRVGRAVEAAKANELAALENRRGIALAALADLAQTYQQLRGTQARLAIADANLLIADENLRLVRRRFADGVATTLDIAQADSERARVAATRPTLQTQIAADINAIGLLLALTPRALEAELARPGPPAAIPAVVPVGFPGTLVRRRPDVLEAEQRLHAATAETGVAIADFYPDIVLNGEGDLNGLRLADAFDIGARAATIGPTITLPIFQGGRLRAQLRLRRAQQREAALAFRETVLRAWNEVDNALTAFAEIQRQRGELAAAAEADRAALEAARRRYQDGAADFLNVNAAASALLQSQDALASADTAIAVDLVMLYRALGGGWEAAELR